MVQVFGKRILGGVGAPDPRMSESFGAGVNTALGQREARQAMQGEAQRQRILEQKFAWEGEDRAEAKRRAAAAAAASAAAKAQNTAVLNALAAGVKLSPLATGVPMGKTYGPKDDDWRRHGLLPPDAAPAGVKVPAPTAGGAKAPVRPTLTLGRSGGSAASSSGGRISSSSDGAPAVERSFNTLSGTIGEVPGASITRRGEVKPGQIVTTWDGRGRMRDLMFPLRRSVYSARPGDFAAQATLRDLEALDTAGVPRAFINAYGGVDTLALPQGRPGDFAAQAAARDLQRAAAGVPPDYVSPDTGPLPAGVEPRGLWDLVFGQTVSTPQGPRVYPGWGANTSVAPYSSLQDYLFPGGATDAQQQQQQQIAEAMGGVSAPAPVDTAEAPAVPAAPAVTPYGEYSLGLEGQPVTPARLSFGPKLGAMPDPIYGTVTDRVVANPPGQPQPVPDMQVYTMDPGRPGRELQQGIDTYSEYVRQAQIYAKYGKTREYLEMATKAKEMENTLFFLQGAQALQELAFNSPQRLSMVLSEQFGREIGIQPNQNGSWDLYADGMLVMQMSKPELSTWARTQIDSTFAASEAARAATYAEEQMKSDIQQNREIAVQRDKARSDMQSEAFKAEVAMQKALFDARVNPANVVLEPDPAGSGNVYVYDKLTDALVGVITTMDFSNPGQSLPAPTFIKTSQ